MGEGDCLKKIVIAKLLCYINNSQLLSMLYYLFIVMLCSCLHFQIYKPQYTAII